MAVQAASLASVGRTRWRYVVRSACTSVLALLVGAVSLVVPRAVAQEQRSDWQVEVRKYCDVNDWPSAIRVLEQRIALAPNDLDLKAWRARVLGWSGNLAEAQQEYLAILIVSPNDPDVWAGLANVYAREGKKNDALLALDRAVQLDPKRADLHAAHARAMREAGKRSESRAEFQKALSFDPSSSEAHAGLHSLRGEPRNELRLGTETDFLSYSAANHGNGANLATPVDSGVRHQPWFCYVSAEWSLGGKTNNQCHRPPAAMGHTNRGRRGWPRQRRNSQERSIL